MQTIDKIIKECKYPIREFSTYKFGAKDRCREVIIETFKKIDKTFNKFEWLPEYDQITEWMTDTKGKGLALFGSVGRGKTVINTFILPVLFRHAWRKVVIPKTAIELTRETINSNWALSIDDIGTENIVNDYGTKIDIVTEAINHAEHKSKLLFLTSNLTEKELINRYGLRTLDRIKRLCKIVIFTGKSLRN